MTKYSSFGLTQRYTFGEFFALCQPGPTGSLPAHESYIAPLIFALKHWLSGQRPR